MDIRGDFKTVQKIAVHKVSQPLTSGICNCLRQLWTLYQPIQAFQVGLPPNPQAVMVFAGHLESTS
jgi:hypothetical protein